MNDVCVYAKMFITGYIYTEIVEKSMCIACLSLSLSLLYIYQMLVVVEVEIVSCSSSTGEARF